MTTPSQTDALADRLDDRLLKDRRGNPDPEMGLKIGPGMYQEILAAVAALRAPNQPVEAVAWQPIEAEVLLDVMNGYLTVHARTDGAFEIHGAEKAAKAIIEIMVHNAALATPPSPQETRRALEPALIGAIVAAMGQRARLMPEEGKEQARSDLDRVKKWADATALSTSPAPAEDVRAAVIEECAAIVGNMRQSEAGIFDAKHSGQRGCDRSDALYDAYVAIRSLTSPDPKQAMQDGGGDTARDNSTDHVDWDILAEERLGQRPRSEHGRHIPQTSPAPGCDSGSHSAQAIPSQIRAAP